MFSKLKEKLRYFLGKSKEKPSKKPEKREKKKESKEQIIKESKEIIEKESKKSSAHWSGRNEHNTVVVFPKEHYKIGDFVNVKTTECTSATLIGKAVGYSDNN